MPDLPGWQRAGRRQVMREHYYGGTTLHRREPQGRVWVQTRYGLNGGSRSRLSHLVKHHITSGGVTLVVFRCQASTFSRVLVRAGQPENACERCLFVVDGLG